MTTAPVSILNLFFSNIHINVCMTVIVYSTEDIVPRSIPSFISNNNTTSWIISTPLITSITLYNQYTFTKQALWHLLYSASFSGNCCQLWFGILPHLSQIFHFSFLLMFFGPQFANYALSWCCKFSLTAPFTSVFPLGYANIASYSYPCALAWKSYCCFFVFSCTLAFANS